MKLAFLLLLLSGCSYITPMNALTIRAALDECRQNQLNVLVFKRPDDSVVAIRCIPKKEDIDKTVTIRQRTPTPIIKILYETAESKED